MTTKELFRAMLVAGLIAGLMALVVAVSWWLLPLMTEVPSPRMY